VGERREEGGEVAAKEMTVEGEGEKWTCCLFSGVLRGDEQEEEEVEERRERVEREGRKGEPKRAARAAAARAAMILASTALMVGVGTAHKADGNAEQSDLLRRMLRPMCVPGDEESGGAPWISRGDVCHSASALWTTVLDPSSTMEETKAVALSSQFPPVSSGGGGGAASWRRPVDVVVAGVCRCEGCIVSWVQQDLARCCMPFRRNGH